MCAGPLCDCTCTILLHILSVHSIALQVQISKSMHHVLAHMLLGSGALRRAVRSTAVRIAQSRLADGCVQPVF